MWIKHFKILRGSNIFSSLSCFFLLQLYRSCYFFPSGYDSWTKGREDCKGREADLVVINSAKEQKFLSEFTKESTWIGLSDRDEEGTWKWIDGTPLTLNNAKSTLWRPLRGQDESCCLFETNILHF
ncbi:hypothetical protein Q5P01_013952 [Channa striata]|uniref:C-type lectin domain-containing protein n=1 Tax=Channa striata TaxID=64152 RepID=A0AA88MKA0_CHASR|nr:hypothetical protein Q5P01_013952 [Channa striata]